MYNTKIDQRDSATEILNKHYHITKDKLRIACIGIFKPIKRGIISAHNHTFRLSVFVQRANPVFSANSRVLCIPRYYEQNILEYINNRVSYLHAAPRGRWVISMMVIDPNNANLQTNGVIYIFLIYNFNNITLTSRRSATR